MVREKCKKYIYFECGKKCDFVNIVAQYLDLNVSVEVQVLQFGCCFVK